MLKTQCTRSRLIKEEAHSIKGMVATKDRLATWAGLEILEAGGNAVDAAVAAAFAIGVVEPSSSGIGGGGYLVYQVGERGGVIGFPMKAPQAACSDMYKLTGDPSVGTFGWAGVVGDENLEGYRAIATPGAVAGLCEAQKRLGRLPLREVVRPAVSLARDGFTPSWYNLYAMSLNAGKLFRHVELGRIFMPGENMPTGDLMSPPKLHQFDLAETLEIIGREGSKGYYRGDIAKAIIADIQSNGGILSRTDLADYRAIVWENGLEFEYRDYTIRVPPYASAGITSAMTLKLLNGFNLNDIRHNSTEMLHLYISAARLAYADRFKYIADPDFVEVPWKGLLSDDYTKLRRSTIGINSSPILEAGDPWAEEGRRPVVVLPASNPGWDDGTTHLCVMDGEGNAVSLTNTLMAGFGSGIVPRGTGVTMNNGMMWFDPVPGRVNSIAPGKIGLNNMTPALVMDGGTVKMVLGASGGRRITNCVSQIIVKVLDFDMGPQAAIDSPRVDCSTPFTSVDSRLDLEVVSGLESRGHSIRSMSEGTLQSGFASFASPLAILRDEGRGFRAGADTFHSAYAEGL